MELSHNDIVQLIKDAGNSVTLTVVPEDGRLAPEGVLPFVLQRDYGWIDLPSVFLCLVDTDNAPPSGTNSAKQSPSAQHRAVGQQPPSYLDRYSTCERTRLHFDLFSSAAM